MYALLDAIGIALRSIWANKLRSFMMVLGNVVAVMSIIAVVSLIQGMNSYVGDAIMRDVGLGTFRIDKTGVITDEEEQEEAWRRNPDVSLADLRAVRSFSPMTDTVMAEGFSRTNIAYRDVTLENVRVRGVSSEYQEFSNYSTDRGRLPSELEVARNRPVALIGADTAEKLFKDRNPIDQAIKVAGVHFRVVGVNERRARCSASHRTTSS